MKGLSKFIEYTFITLFGFILLTVISTVLYDFYDNSRDSNTIFALKEIALQTSNGITKLYETSIDSNAEPMVNESIIVATINMEYPSKILDRDYEILLISSPGIYVDISEVIVDEEEEEVTLETSSHPKVLVRTTDGSDIEYEQVVNNIPIEIEGSYTPGDNSTLSYIKYNDNGSEEEIITFDNTQLLIGVDSVS